jgi:hypothetical protein
MPPPGPETRSAADLPALAETIFRTLARQFPVCLSSDEFHYFPQVLVKAIDWTRWDDFSAPALDHIINQLTVWEGRLAPASHPSSAATASPSADTMDATMLLRVVRTLRSQFAHVCAHKRQPSFYLTIAGIGLAEALEAGPTPFRARLEHLPAFLDQAIENLEGVPRLFRDLGAEMLTTQRNWLNALALPDRHRLPLQRAYRRLATHLEELAVQERFLPPVDLYAEIASDHMGCRLTLAEISTELETELTETRALLTRWAAAVAPGRPWQAVVKDLPRPSTPAEDPGSPYRDTITRLAAHCTAIGLIRPNLVVQNPVGVAAIPAYMGPVRSSAAYSMPPGHPPQGGTFYIAPADGSRSLPADHRLLTAHETYPGHHLLDTCRWRHPRPVRRQIEFPIFYEGWASFSEELLFDTGFFSGPADALLMAKRRFWRALRGRTDLDIHMRRKSMDDAAASLIAEGLPKTQARAMVRRYCLKPGYQLAYTLGRRRFRRLYEAWCDGKTDPVGFAHRVLALGQIDFHHLERMLQKGG